MQYLYAIYIEQWQTCDYRRTC